MADQNNKNEMTPDELKTATDMLRMENRYLRMNIDMFNINQHTITQLKNKIEKLEKRLEEISPDELKPLENEQFSIELVSSNYRENKEKMRELSKRYTNCIKNNQLNK